jgi:2-polyprenyl-3-methyl-5-hydroxy-6-metoxy-1,4-benzoquinol methylase
MQESTQTMYEVHNLKKRGIGFSLLKEERGNLLKEKLGTGKKILDLGCRDGALTSTFVEGNTVTGADIDTVALTNAKKLGIETLHVDLNGDWHELNGQTYDAVVLAETLEHLFYPEQVIERVKAVLKKDAMFIGSVPNAFNLKNRVRLFLGQKHLTPLQDPTHINHFKHEELESLLKKHFRNVEMIPVGSHASLDHLWKGMFSFMLFFVCTEKIETEK